LRDWSLRAEEVIRKKLFASIYFIYYEIDDMTILLISQLNS